MFSGNQSPDQTVQPDVPASSDGTPLLVQPPRSGFLAGVVFRVRAFTRLLAPMGYQDATGFHFESRSSGQVREDQITPPSGTGASGGAGGFSLRASADSFHVNFCRVIHSELKQRRVRVKLEV